MADGIMRRGFRFAPLIIVGVIDISQLFSRHRHSLVPTGVTTVTTMRRLRIYGRSNSFIGNDSFEFANDRRCIPTLNAKRDPAGKVKHTVGVGDG